MQIPAELSAARSVRDKVVTAAEAVRLIRDGDSVVVEGLVLEREPIQERFWRVDDQQLVDLPGTRARQREHPARPRTQGSPPARRRTPGGCSR
jgi:hypothetical protein